MTEAVVPLFLPPPLAARPAVPSDPLPLQRIPANSPHPPLTMTIAKIDHSGRIPAADVIAALNWAVHDRTYVSVSTDAIIVRRTTAKRPAKAIDSRRQLFIPAGARAQFGIRAGDRLLLVAIPDSAILLVHPIAMAAAILTNHYRRKRYP